MKLKNFDKKQKFLLFFVMLYVYIMYEIFIWLL